MGRMALTPSPSHLEGSEEPQAVWTTKGANVWTTNGAKWQEGRERETAPLWPGSRWFAPVRGFVVQRAWDLGESGVRAAVPERKV